jgi:predicted N-acetyltransferase YhbS
MANIFVRQMLESDLEAAMGLKNAEGWNQTELDWLLFLRHNPELCLVACLKDVVIGTVTAINYNNEVAWVGMMLVSRDFRNQGVGKLLLKTVIDLLAGCQSIKLDATPTGKPVYRKMGFVEELDLHRMTIQKLPLIDDGLLSSEIRSIENSDIPEIARLDQLAFGSNRTWLFQRVFKNLPGQSWMSVHDGRISGFLLGRVGTRFNHIGPLVADSMDNAKALLAQVSKDLSGKPVVMDIPEAKPDWLAWVSELGFSQQRSLSRMYLNKNLPSKKGDSLFAIMGPELG